jgi:tetratricopeptide (TPR) repeat protein
LTPASNRFTPAETLQHAISAYQAGQLDAAAQACELALRADPKQVDAVNLLGAIALRRGDAALALEHFTRAAQLLPRHAEAHSNRGVALQALSRWDEALACFRRALDIDPLLVDALYNRGVVQSALKRWNEAAESYDRVIRLRPDHAAAWNNRGNVMQELGRWPEALQSYERALQLRGENPELLTNRGVALLELGRPRDALQSFDRAASLDSRYAEAQWCKSMALLLLGDFERGWPLQEWRWLKKHPPEKRHSNRPLWLAAEEIAGKTILLHADEGFGDTIHMARYAPLVEARGARVLLEVYAPLARLMRSLSPSIEVIARGSPVPGSDFQCPLGSLPHALRTTLESIPLRDGYLRAEPQVVEEWSKRLGRRTRPRIGLAWSGNAAHERDHERSLAFERLLPLLSDAFEFHALQKDIRPPDREVLVRDGRVRWWGEQLGDFADTAALVENLDLVISVDTSVAHLAAALGKPTWILLAHIADYRWLLDRSDSPWYASVRLFRQPSRGDWDTVLGEVGSALHGLCNV